MKIFMYSDVHISKTSSILPLTSSNYKYTYRQNMIIETGKYITDIIDEVRPDVIINLGDTFDQHTITSYDIDVASAFFKEFRMLDIPHLVLVGNHEMINQDFNAIEILSNINNITVITEPCTIDIDFITSLRHPDADLTNTPKEESGGSLAFMPYMEYKDILNFPDGTFLFSHIDIMGMQIRGDYELPDGVSKEQLSKYKLVFNGHIHKPSFKNNVVNVGSVTTHSFADDNDSVPQCYLFDTNTLDLKTFKPKVCPLFRKVEIQDEMDLIKYLNYLDKDYKYVLQITCPFEIKERIKELVKNAEFVIANKLNVKVNKEVHQDEKSKVEVQSNIDIKKSFTEFLDTVDELKYPKQLYYDVLKDMKCIGSEK